MDFLIPLVFVSEYIGKLFVTVFLIFSKLNTYLRNLRNLISRNKTVIAVKIIWYPYMDVRDSTPKRRIIVEKILIA